MIKLSIKPTSIDHDVITTNDCFKFNHSIKLSVFKTVKKLSVTPGSNNKVITLKVKKHEQT
jgi:hypothetical protein